MTEECGNVLFRTRNGRPGTSDWDRSLIEGRHDSCLKAKSPRIWEMAGSRFVLSSRAFQRDRGPFTAAYRAHALCAPDLRCTGSPWR